MDGDCEYNAFKDQIDRKTKVLNGQVKFAKLIQTIVKSVAKYLKNFFSIDFSRISIKKIKFIN